MIKMSLRAGKVWSHFLWKFADLSRMTWKDWSKVRPPLDYRLSL